jgi:Peptidase A4 family
MKTSQRVVNRRLFLEELEGRLAPSASSLLGNSINWSGYAIAASPGPVTSVVGSWTVPAVTGGAGSTYSAQWVGIDGYTSPTVEQIGTESDVTNGVANYYAWYEMYPRGYVTLPLTVHAGDVISAGVSYGSGGFTLTLTDSTSGKPTFSTTQTMSNADLSSAEWIVEAPSNNRGPLPLANFGTTSFSGAQATIAGTTGAIDSFSGSNQVNQIDMISSRSGATLDQTSGLTDSGNSSSFSVTFSGQATSNPTPPSFPAPPPPPPHHHHGGPPGRTPDQIVALPVISTATLTGTSVAISPLGGATQFLSAPARPATPDIGFGTLRFDFYMVGETLDQPDDGGDDGAVPTAPAQSAPVQRDNNVQPLVVHGQMAGVDQAHWLAAVDAVFAQDFQPPEVALPAQADRFDISDTQDSQAAQGFRETDRSLASGLLVLAGAGLLLGTRPRSTKYPWAIEDDGRRYRIIL